MVRATKAGGQLRIARDVLREVRVRADRPLETHALRCLAIDEGRRIDLFGSGSIFNPLDQRAQQIVIAVERNVGREPLANVIYSPASPAMRHAWSDEVAEKLLRRIQFYCLRELRTG